MGKLLLIMALWLAPLPASLPAALAEYYPAISEESDYREIRNLSLRLVEKFPPAEYHYVGVGRSPAPVMAFLREAGMATTTIPLSGLRKAGQVEKIRADLPGFLAEHFEQYLPSEKKIRGKKILLIDYASEGNTILETKKYLAEYLAKAGRSSSFETVAFTIAGKRNHDRLLQKLNADDVSTLAVRADSWLAESLFESTLESHAEYGYFPVDKKIAERKLLGRPLPKVDPNPDFVEFGEELREYMASDLTWRARLKPFVRECPNFFQRIAP